MMHRSFYETFKFISKIDFVILLLNNWTSFAEY